MRARAERGFTLIELIVIVAIFGLVAIASTLALQNVMRSKLRSAASRTAATMRFSFDRATMTGMYLRMAFDLEKGEIWVEGSEDRVGLRAGSEQHATSDKEDKDHPDEEGQAQQRRKKKKKQPPIPFFAPPEVEGGEGEGEEGAGDEEDEEGVQPGIIADDLLADFEADMAPVARAKANFTPLKGMLDRKRIKLDKQVVIDAVITPRMNEPVVKGRTYVYFFPQGHGEPAIIHLRRKETEDYYSVVLHPLTGQARVYPCLYKIPEEFGVSDDQRSRKGGDPCAREGGVR